MPLVVERLITTIEMYGLYTEGIYRKSGVRFSNYYFCSSLLFFIFMFRRRAVITDFTVSFAARIQGSRTEMSNRTI